MSFFTSIIYGETWKYLVLIYVRMGGYYIALHSFLELPKCHIKHYYMVLLSSRCELRGNHFKMLPWRPRSIHTLSSLLALLFWCFIFVVSLNKQLSISRQVNFWVVMWIVKIVAMLDLCRDRGLWVTWQELYSHWCINGLEFLSSDSLISFIDVYLYDRVSINHL